VVSQTVSAAFWVAIVGFTASFLIYAFLFRPGSVALLPGSEIRLNRQARPVRSLQG
jgi:hypothetical protein